MFEDFTKEEKKVLAKVLDRMHQIGIFKGVYDAENGNKNFMYGISTVMECLAYGVSEDVGENYNHEFLKNMLESENRV